jgi:primosomal protein N' (replication factor Y) (superfamily II helicase)
MIADVVFDAPMSHPFSYRVPDGLRVAPGQRVLAPLRGAARIGLVVGVREHGDEQLRSLVRAVDAEPVLSAAQLDLAHWVATESLTSLGATCAALLPPPVERATRAARAGPVERAILADRAGAECGPGRSAPADGPRPELLVGAGRERRALERIASAEAAIVLAADVETAGRWAGRLAKLGRVVRLDSGVVDDARERAWAELARGEVGLAVGTRSALLAPLPRNGCMVLLDEHDAAHKPPGPPRMHARDVVLERARRECAPTVLTSATPSVEVWWRADRGDLVLGAAAPAPWPAVTVADTRGILRREPLTPPLARAMRETLALGRRVFLGVSRLASALACDECGAVVRCGQCALALGYSRAAAVLTCRLCADRMPLPDLCPECRGRRLSPFGWGAERVEHAVRRRFPTVRVARYDPDAARGARGEAQRAAAAAADVVIGTRGALRLFGPASLGLAGFVSPDQLLRVPDFRSSERAFALMWAAAERVRGDGAVVVQSQNPSHYVLDALARQDLTVFYKHELKFRAELGYPPFRRLAVIAVRGAGAMETRALADDVVAAARGSARLTVYPSIAERHDRQRRIVVKGHADLAAVLRPLLEDLLTPRLRSRGIMNVEVDPVEWQS